MKTCTNCNKDKDESGFTSNGRGGLHTQCKDCRNMKDRKRRTKAYNRKVNMRQLLKKYRITLEEYNDMRYVDQSDRCKICGISFEDIDTRMIHIDHCHKSGKVRGILCRHCNVTLGNTRDNIDYLKAMVTYLEQAGN